MGQKDKNSGHYLNSHLLLAMPAIGDPRFHRATIYVCAHDEKGAMGIVINNTMPNLKFGNLLQDLDIKSNITLPPTLQHLPVLCGGPVESNRGFLIHSNDFEQIDTVKVQPDVHVTGTIDALIALRQSQIPKHLIFALGYAGWGAGQLEQEVRDNAWLTLPATTDLIFNSEINTMWDKGLQTIGVSADKLSSLTGSA
jgi:putative transcriptional regulator